MFSSSFVAHCVTVNVKSEGDDSSHWMVIGISYPKKKYSIQEHEMYPLEICYITMENHHEYIVNCPMKNMVIWPNSLIASMYLRCSSIYLTDLEICTWCSTHCRVIQNISRQVLEIKINPGTKSLWCYQQQWNSLRWTCKKRWINHHAING